MADLRNKIFGLAGAALLCTGMAYGQATCGAAGASVTPTITGGATLLRAESTYEQVPSTTFVCKNNTAGATAAGPINIQLYMAPALPITSKVDSLGSSEAVVLVQTFADDAETAPLTAAGVAAVVGPPATSVYFKLVAGTILGGSNLNFAISAANSAIVPAGGHYKFSFFNIRVNLSSIAIATGAPPTVAVSGFISGGATTLSANTIASTTLGFAQNSIGSTQQKQIHYATGALLLPDVATNAPNTTGANNFVICNAYSPKIDIAAGSFSTTTGGWLGAGGTTAGAGKSLMSAIRVDEQFPTAFRIAGTPGAVTAGAAPAPPTVAPNIGNNEAAQIARTDSGNGNSLNPVNSATRVKAVFTNVPANVTLLVPVGPIASTRGGPGALTLTTSETGAFSAASASTSTNAGGLAVASYTPSSGAITIVYELTGQDDSNLDRYYIPVFIVTTANGVAGTSTPVNTSVSYAPIGSTNDPNFAIGSSTTALTGSTFSLCSTSLLFPFVTNQLGFDTGLAISNTSTDPFGSLGATPQAGTCTLNFYGNGAPTPSNVTTANIPSGTVYAAPLSSVAAGFQGYMIAQCQFQFAHGFAFITDGVGVNGGLSQGYLAGVIPDVNQGARSANDTSKAVAGAGETLGN
jgi:hypothetical protein